jgi:hypothetical protein
MSNRITVLVLEPGREPYIKEIENSLDGLQREVGGTIQALFPYADPVALLCHEEGTLLGLPWNRVLRDDDGFIYDVIVGTCLIVGLTEDDLGSLPEDLVDKYTEVFKESF